MMISRSARAQAPARRAEWSHRIASAGVAAGERVGAPEQRREAELAVHGRDVARGDGGVEADGSDVEGAIAVAAPDLEGGEGAGAGVGAGEAGLGDADDGAAARVVEALAEAGVVRSEPDVRVDDDELVGPGLEADARGGDPGVPVIDIDAADHEHTISRTRRGMMRR